jgi:hypothetical protein
MKKFIQCTGGENLRFEIGEAILTEYTSKILFEELQYEHNSDVTFEDAQMILNQYKIIKRNSPIGFEESVYEDIINHHRMPIHRNYYYLVRKYSEQDLKLYYELYPDKEGIIYQVYLT